MGAGAWAVARRGLLGWCGCWAEQLGRASGPAAGGPSGEEGEESERPRGKKAMRAENEEGEEKIIFPFYFPTNFPKSIFKLFLNSFEH